MTHSSDDLANSLTTGVDNRKEWVNHAIDGGANAVSDGPLFQVADDDDARFGLEKATGCVGRVGDDVASLRMAGASSSPRSAQHGEASSCSTYSSDNSADCLSFASGTLVDADNLTRNGSLIAVKGPHGQSSSASRCQKRSARRTEWTAVTDKNAARRVMNLFIIFGRGLQRNEAGRKAVKGESTGKVIKKGKKEQPRHLAATSCVSKT